VLRSNLLTITTRKLNRVATLLAATILLSSAAIYNGYPLVWPDTSGYIGLNNPSLYFRSFFYNLFIFPTLLTGSLWPVVFVQSLIIAHLLQLVLRTVFSTVSTPVFLGITALLSLLSSLPWFTGLIMPDIFTSVVVLSLFLLIFCPHRLEPGELKYLFALTTVATAVHFTHFPLAVGLLLAGMISHLAAKNHNKLPVAYLARPFFAVALALGLLLANSYLSHGFIGISPGGYAFPLARLVADGPAVRYLREHCSEKEYALCNYIDDLPSTSEDFLWSADSPFLMVGWFEGYRLEGQEIVEGTISHYPLWTLQTAMRNTIHQVRTFRTGCGLIPYLESSYPTATIREYLQGDFHAYEVSKQNRDRLGLNKFNRLHKAFIALSLLYALIVFLIFLKRREWLLVYLFIAIAFAYLLNAFLCGAISGPNGRYASRLIWMLPFVSLAAGIHLSRGKRSVIKWYNKLK
jgi:hypothetical protein